MLAPQASSIRTRKPLRQVPGAHRCVLPGAPHLDHNRIHTYSSHYTSHTRIPHIGCTDRTHIQVPQTAPLLDTMYDLATHRALSANTEKHPLRKLIQQNWLRIQHEASPTVYSRIQRVRLYKKSQTVDTKESSSEKHPTIICSTSETRRDENEHFWKKQLQKS